MKVSKWVTLEDGAGRIVTVRRVDAREIEEGKARRAAEAKGEVVVEAKGKAVVEAPEPEPLMEVDDQSVAPKAKRKK